MSQFRRFNVWFSETQPTYLREGQLWVNTSTNVISSIIGGSLETIGANANEIISQITGAAPETLNTLEEIAQALNDNPNILDLYLTSTTASATYLTQANASATYLTSFTETDPVFTASDAASITSSDITNWDTSYGWGDHSEAGYLTDASASTTYATINYVNQGDAEFTQNNQTGTSYTFALADADKIVTASNASPVTFTIPPSASVAWVDNTILRVANYGAGALSIAGGAGVTVTNSSTTLSQYQSGVIVRVSSNAWTFIPFAGGASPLSDSSVTGTTGSPTTSTYSSGGVNYKNYRFNGTGSITLSKAGLVDVVLVGGGGGGGNVYGGGGGAGGHVYKTNYYLESGTTTVTIGAGGSVNGHGGDSVLASLVAVGGGAGCTGGGANVANAGGSSGGNSDTSPNYGAGVTGQGNRGGWGAGYGRGGGGGGAGGIGGDGSGPGGIGVYTEISNGAAAGQLSSGNYYLAGGGGGNGNDSLGTGAGGIGGGGQGAWDWNPQASVAGTANTGGGGGGGTDARGGSAGGSGTIIIRVRA